MLPAQTRHLSLLLLPTMPQRPTSLLLSSRIRLSLPGTNPLQTPPTLEQPTTEEPSAQIASTDSEGTRTDSAADNNSATDEDKAPVKAEVPVAPELPSSPEELSGLSGRA